MKAKKTRSRKQLGSGKRRVKDLPSRKSQDVKGGYRWTSSPTRVDSHDEADEAPWEADGKPAEERPPAEEDERRAGRISGGSAKAGTEQVRGRDSGDLSLHHGLAQMTHRPEFSLRMTKTPRLASPVERDGERFFRPIPAPSSRL